MKRFSVLIILLITILSACVKEAGEGGTGTIVGKVFAYDYNAELTVFRTQYYAPEEDVYIIYGNDSMYSDRTKTNFDGTYRFKYLRPGTYTIFVYSKNLNTKLPPDLAEKKTVAIISDNQVVFVDDIEIIK
ncbi:MAG: hypothetical protein KAH17_02790 [Bacteroidales bacterium]|nr:hypothetical protein [Bacteroidales bacterium]